MNRIKATKSFRLRHSIESICSSEKLYSTGLESSVSRTLFSFCDRAVAISFQIEQNFISGIFCVWIDFNSDQRYKLVLQIQVSITKCEEKMTVFKRNKYRVATERLNDIKKNNFYKHMFFYFILFIFFKPFSLSAATLY